MSEASDTQSVGESDSPESAGRAVGAGFAAGLADGTLAAAAAGAATGAAALTSGGDLTCMRSLLTRLGCSADDPTGGEDVDEAEDGSESCGGGTMRCCCGRLGDGGGSEPNTGDCESPLGVNETAAVSDCLGLPAAAEAAAGAGGANAAEPAAGRTRSSAAAAAAGEKLTDCCDCACWLADNDMDGNATPAAASAAARAGLMAGRAGCASGDRGSCAGGCDAEANCGWLAKVTWREASESPELVLSLRSMDDDPAAAPAAAAAAPAPGSDTICD